HMRRSPFASPWCRGCDHRPSRRIRARRKPPALPPRANSSPATASRTGTASFLFLLLWRRRVIQRADVEVVVIRDKMAIAFHDDRREALDEGPILRREHVDRRIPFAHKARELRLVVLARARGEI